MAPAAIRARSARAVSCEMLTKAVDSRLAASSTAAYRSWWVAAWARASRAWATCTPATTQTTASRAQSTTSQVVDRARVALTSASVGPRGGAAPLIGAPRMGDCARPPGPRPSRRARTGWCVRRHPSGVLLLAQLLAVLAYPFADNSDVGRSLLGLVGTGVVLIALWAVRRTPALGWVALLLGGPAMIFTVLEAAFPDQDAIILVSALLHAPFYFYVSYGMIRYLFHDDRVTTDELYATGAAFTVVAWGFAYVFVGLPGGVARAPSSATTTRPSTRSSSCCSSPSPT